MNFYYFIWFLLPLFYIAIILKAYVKRAAKSHALEDEKHYLKQLMYCLAAFVVAVVIDKSLDPNFFADTPLSELGDTDVFFWLIYPAVLFLGGAISGLFTKKKKKEVKKKWV